MQRIPTTPEVGVEERRYSVGQSKPFGSSEQAESEEYVAQGKRAPASSANGNLSPEAEEHLVGFFRLLLEIDRRLNPQLYGKPTRDASCQNKEVEHGE
jgi:hypothetical protein